MSQLRQLTPMQIAIVLLTVATAIIHIVLAIPSPAPMNIIFFLNGLGYLALVAGLYLVPQLDNMHTVIRWVLVGYAAVTIILFFVFNAETGYGPLGLITKAIEVVLIILLIMDSRR